MTRRRVRCGTITLPRSPERGRSLHRSTPIIAKLRRCFDGKDGQLLADELDAARGRVSDARGSIVDIGQQTDAAVAYARDHHLSPCLRSSHVSDLSTPELPGIGVATTPITQDTAARHAATRDGAWSW